jgi:sirohydrochlorin cobaltochelatase
VNPTTTGHAVVLLAHGSSDADWAVPVQSVATRLADLGEDVTVTTAYLAHTPPALEEAVAALRDAGIARITVLGFFLSSGGKHMRKDIPLQIAGLRRRFPDLELRWNEAAIAAEPEVIEAAAHAALRLLG